MMSDMIRPFPGFGLGLRRDHYADFLTIDQPVDFVEVISENFMACGGQPLRTLHAVRERHALALHGVSMSLGSPDGLDADYMAALKALARQVDPLWVSDHLCWTRVDGFATHDLLPLPYTEAALTTCIANIRQAQDMLERPMLIENPSSYVSFAESSMTEWAFLAQLCAETGCFLLLDVNNVYVSSVNHGFDPMAFLAGLPVDRVRQIHLAGHSAGPEGMLIDTHDAAVCTEVWDLYSAAIARFGPCATMIERDDKIPPLADLLDELGEARRRGAALLHAA
ncbi:MAG: hypothetical protein RJB22_181 [Pseudomonadota bacterium]